MAQTNRGQMMAAGILKRALGTVLAVLIVLSGCTAQSGGKASPKRPVPDPTIEQLQISDGTIWTSDSLQVHPITALVLTDDTVVIQSENGLITAVDLTTGAEAWRLDPGATLPGDPSSLVWTGSVVAASGVVVVPYFATACQQDLCHQSQVEISDESGYAGLDAKTGSLLWKAATIPGVPPDSPEQEYLSSLNDSLALANSTTLFASVRVLNGQAPPSGKPWATTFAFDIVTGALLWEAADVAAIGLGEDFVYGGLVTSTDPTSIGTPAALDAATGSQLWSMPHDDLPYLYAGFGNDGALIVENTPAPPLTAVTSTGEFTAVGENLLWACSQASVTGRLACVLDDFENPARIVTLSDGKPYLSEIPLSHGTAVGYVDDDYIYLYDSDSSTGTSYAADAHGNRLSRDFPGRVVATSSNYVMVLQLEDENRVGAVYART